MRKFYYFIPSLLIVTTAIIMWSALEVEPSPKKLTKQQRIEGAIEDRIFTSSDVDLGYIPHNKLLKAIEEGERRLSLSSQSRSLGGSLTDAVWRERGPINVGGRTRAILVDESDPNRNRIWVGGVSGGLWRTEDITQQDPQWEKLGIYFESTSIGDIAQDPNNFATLYVGTGESYTGDFLGVGIYKTTDDGETWTLLPSTRNGNFSFVNEIHVHSNSDIYAATSTGGIFRSKDGGGVWESVLATGLSGANNNDFHDIIFNETNQTFYASNDNSVFKSPTGNRGDWTNIGNAKPGFPNDINRAELAVCPSNPDVMYVLGASGSMASYTCVSNDGGESWTARSAPSIFPGQDFTNGQAWYDLEIAVDAANCARLLAGGVGMLESTFQAISWQGVAEGQIHVDHHYIVFDHKKPGRVFYGNDGGIWMSNNGGVTIINKNAGYVTTQFYCGAIHPDIGSPYLLGGTQDNNSLQLTQPGLSPANSVWGGDGVFCFIDQNEPLIQIVSSQGGSYGLSRDGGLDFGLGAEVNGAFINRSGYDDIANVLYGQTNSNMGDFFRWNINTETLDFVAITGHLISVSAVKADPDPNFPNRIYLGGGAGVVIRIDDPTHQGTTINGTVIADLPVNASVSSIYMDKQSSDEMLISLFNYGGSLENVWITYNGGGEWTAIEGDLPDMPVRWAMFDPANHDRVMLATEAGIWTTENVDGDLTHWEPADPGNGMPFVRVDMLLMRDSDKVVLGVTHGRGLMTTDVFSAPAAVILAQPIAYEGQELIIDGSHSVNAQSYEWDLGDNTTSTEAIVTHTYNAPGNYTITLTINGTITLTRSISILPYLPAPYQIGEPDYAGDFETKPEHFAAYNISGSDFQRGISTKAGKDGTHSGTNAWVLGKDENLYANNGRAELYTPQYDLSESGLYELKFWAKFAIQNPHDGFQVEYTLDGGASWLQLGTRNNPKWYNYHNANLADGAFPMGKDYFTSEQLNWTQYVKDVSFLAGEPRVAFRYVFRSDAQDQGRGLAIDDFEITKYQGELRTMITVFEAAYTGDQEVTVSWTTGIEYQAKEFILERSFTGFGFSEVGRLNAKGVVSTFAQQYEWVDQSLRNVIYYRLKVINDNPALNYHLEFYSDTIVVRRDIEADIVHSVLPNPFDDRILISFSSLINQDVFIRLYDTSGRLIRDEKSTPNGVATDIDKLNLPPGVYILSVQIGENEPSTYKLLTYRP